MPRIYKSRRELVQIWTAPGVFKLVDSIRAAFLVDSGVASLEDPPADATPLPSKPWLKMRPRKEILEEAENG